MKSISIVVPLLLLAGRVAAQAPVPSPLAPAAAPAPLRPIIDVEDEIDISTGEVKPVGSGKIITNETLNHFAAERQAYYLSGATNLSLFKNFALANVTDGTLQVGHNYAPHKKEDLIKSVITVAAQSNIANNVSNLFSKDKLANDLGLVLGYTLFLTNQTGVKVNKGGTKELNAKRAFQYALLKKKTDAELALINSVDPVEGNNVDIHAGERKIAKDNLSKKATKEFFDNELASFKEQDPSFYTSWVRFQGFVPLTGSVYQVASPGSMNFQEETTWKWSGGINYGFIREKFWNGGAIFLNLSARALYTNAVVQQTDGVKTYTQYNLMNPQAQANQVYYDGDGSKVYVGGLGNAWVYPLRAQVIYLFKGEDNKIGVDLQVEQYTFNYAKTNFLLGIPVFLKGQDDKGVNVEAQFRWRDVDKRVLGSDRFSVGLSVALPFGGSLN